MIILLPESARGQRSVMILAAGCGAQPQRPTHPSRVPQTGRRSALPTCPPPAHIRFAQEFQEGALLGSLRLRTESTPRLPRGSDGALQPFWA